jgi:hypothetical protein
LRLGDEDREGSADPEVEADETTRGEEAYVSFLPEAGTTMRGEIIGSLFDGRGGVSIKKVALILL